MLLLFCTFFFGHFFCGAFVGLLFSAFTLATFGEALGIILGVSELVFFFALLCSVPAIGKVAGCLLDRAAIQVKDGQIFESLCVLFGCAVFLHGGEFLRIFESYVTLHAAGAFQSMAVLFGALVSTVVFCGGLVALVFCVLLLAFELPAQWVSSVKTSKTSGAGVSRAFVALRPLTLLVLLSLSARLCIGFVGHELSAYSVQARVVVVSQK